MISKTLIWRKYTGFKTECGVKIFVTDTLKVVLRNNVEFIGKVVKDGKDFCVDIGRKLILSKCYKDEYNGGLDAYHKRCGWRYAVFYKYNSEKEKSRENLKGV